MPLRVVYEWFTHSRTSCPQDLLVQHYVDNPYLINGFKFDMRVYVAATCVDPLR